MREQKASRNVPRAIYMVVMRTDTIPAKAIRMATRVPYSHVSLSPDASLKQMFSFCRSYSRIPLPATFNEELIGQGTLGHFEEIPCEIYKIPVTEEKYQRFLMLIDHFQACRRQYSYSLMGLVWVRLQIEKELRNKFVCSQFVAYMLEECGISLEKAASLYSPDDLRFLPQAELVYRGELNRYYHEQTSLYEVYQAVSPVI